MLGTGEKTNLPLDFRISTKYNCINENESETHLKKELESLKDCYTCVECGKQFSNKQILQLHLKVHQASTKSMEQCYSAVTQTSVEIITQSNDKNTAFHGINYEENKQQSHTLPVKRVTGLTKLRLKDYRRCDACSCIYLEEVDYFKHMKNFHNQDASKKKKKIPRKKECRSCCKNCKCNRNFQQIPEKHLDDKNYTLHLNIKDRWSKLMEGTKTSVIDTGPPLEIKTEPLDEDEETLDYSHLLSQVEVRIKTEPVDELEYNSQCGE